MGYSGTNFPDIPKKCQVNPGILVVNISKDKNSHDISENTGNFHQEIVHTTFFSNKNSPPFLLIILAGLTCIFFAVLIYLIWQYGLWSFQTGDIKLERFLPKN
jgi:hypothetical protein